MKGGCFASPSPRLGPRQSLCLAVFEFSFFCVCVCVRMCEEEINASSFSESVQSSKNG